MPFGFSDDETFFSFACHQQSVSCCEKKRENEEEISLQSNVDDVQEMVMMPVLQ